MKTYTQIFEDKIYQYFYDTYIKLWTIYEINDYGEQISEEADHSPRKSDLIITYPFLTFKTNFEIVKDPPELEEKDFIIKSCKY